MSGYVRAVNFVKKLVKGGSKTSPTISSVKANVPVTKGEKIKSKLNISFFILVYSTLKYLCSLYTIDARHDKNP